MWDCWMLESLDVSTVCRQGCRNLRNLQPYPMNIPGRIVFQVDAVAAYLWRRSTDALLRTGLLVRQVSHHISYHSLGIQL